MFKGRQTACRGKVRKKKTWIVCFVYLPFSRVCEKRVFHFYQNCWKVNSVTEEHWR